MLSDTDRWIFSRGCTFPLSPCPFPCDALCPAYFGVTQRNSGLPRTVRCGRQVCPKLNDILSMQMGWCVDSLKFCKTWNHPPAPVTSH